MTVYVYCDESGKFKDHTVVSFGAVAGGIRLLDGFEETWKRCLREAGLSCFTMKEALNLRKPFSEANPAKSADKRTEAILPFVDCMKRHLGLLTGFAIDVGAFHRMSQAAQKQLGKNPQYTAFTRTIQEVIREEMSEGDDLCIVCDDEEQVALGVYKLYRKLKLWYPVARKKIISLSLADDEFFYPLQGADLIASLVRMEARRMFFGDKFDYPGLYERLTTKLDTPPQAAVKVGLFGEGSLDGLSKTFIEFEQKYVRYGVAPLVEE